MEAPGEVIENKRFRIDIYYDNLADVGTILKGKAHIFLGAIANRTIENLSSLVDLGTDKPPKSHYTIRFESHETASLNQNAPSSIEKNAIPINSAILDRTIADSSYVIQHIIASIYKQSNPLWKGLDGEGRLQTQVLRRILLEDKTPQTGSLIKPISLQTPDDLIKLGNNMSFLVSTLGLLILNRNTDLNILIYDKLLNDPQITTPNHKLYYAGNVLTFIRAKAGVLIPGIAAENSLERYTAALKFYFNLTDPTVMMAVLNDQVRKVTNYKISRKNIVRSIDRLKEGKHRGSRES